VDGVVIHSWPPGRVTGVRIEGSSNTETFVIPGGLGFPVEVAGNDGMDTLAGPSGSSAWRVRPGTDGLWGDFSFTHVSGEVNADITFRHMR
jgi:hypothetical protein